MLLSYIVDCMRVLLKLGAKNVRERAYKRDNVWARAMKASLNVEDVVHFSTLCSNMSSNVPE